MSDLESQKGREPYGLTLTDYEKELRDKILGNPLDWPDAAKTYISDYVSQNSLLPISQVQGFTQFLGQQASISTLESTASTSFVNLTTTGPTIDNLAKGSYLIWFGAGIEPVAGANVAGVVSPVFNGTTGSSDLWVYGGGDASGGNTMINSTARAVVQDLTASTNSVSLKYKSFTGTTVSFLNRWVVVLRIGNL